MMIKEFAKTGFLSGIAISIIPMLGNFSLSSIQMGVVDMGVWTFSWLSIGLVLSATDMSPNRI